MAENKSELKVEDEADYTENVDPEYKNYSSVARKPFKGDEKKSSTTSSTTKQAESPQTPKAPTK